MIRAIVARTVREALLSKGFRLSEKGNRDHEMYFLHVDELKTSFFVKISRNAVELRTDEIKNSARQMKVSGDDLYRILCCDYDSSKTLAVYRGRAT
jgi:hypothetical protein